MEDESRLPGWMVPAVGVAVVVVLVIIGLSRGPATLDPSTPEGTVQLYIQSVVEGDFDTASTYWADDGCTPTSEIPTGGTPDVSASLVSVDGNDIEASVTVRLTESSPDPLGGLYEYEEWFTLIRNGETWKIRQPAWPYWDMVCEESA
ncbi:MAG TPA: hypothetical protein VLS86_10620 [Acidimicrobiia bacterium]|nr:hypothetical protein [Acidimicrobiia bacterium]